MKVWGSWKRVGFHMFEFLHQNDGWLFGILVYIMCQCFKKYLYFNMYIHVNHVSISGLSWKNLLQERWIAYLPAEFSQPSSVGSFFLATGYQDTRKCRISKIGIFSKMVEAMVDSIGVDSWTCRALLPTIGSGLGLRPPRCWVFAIPGDFWLQRHHRLGNLEGRSTKHLRTHKSESDPDFIYRGNKNRNHICVWCLLFVFFLPLWSRAIVYCVSG